MGEFLVPLMTLADFEDAKMAARVINDHSLAKMVTRKRKIPTSRKTIFMSVLSWKKLEDTSSSPPCNLKESLLEGTQCSEIQLFVRSSLRPTLCLQLHPSTTVSGLKGLLQEKLKIEQENQHLFTKRHRELRDGASLKDHGIVQDSKLDLRLASELVDGSDQRKSTGKEKRRRKSKAGYKSSSEEEDKTLNLSHKDDVNSNYLGDPATYSTSGVSNSNQSKEDTKLHTSSGGGSQDPSDDSGCSSTSAAKHATKRTIRRRRKVRGKSPSDESRGQTSSSDENKTETGGLSTSSGVEAASNQPKSGRKIKRRRKAAKKSPSKEEEEEVHDNTSRIDEEQEVSDDSSDSAAFPSPTVITKAKRRTRRRRRKVRGKSPSDESRGQTPSSDEDKTETGELSTSSGVEAASNQFKSGRKRRRRRKAAKKSPSKEAEEEEVHDNTSRIDEEQEVSDDLSDSAAFPSPTVITKGNSREFTGKESKRKRRRRSKTGHRQVNNKIDSGRNKSQHDQMQDKPDGCGDSVTLSGVNTSDRTSAGKMQTTKKEKAMTDKDAERTQKGKGNRLKKSQSEADITERGRRSSKKDNDLRLTEKRSSTAHRKCPSDEATTNRKPSLDEKEHEKLGRRKTRSARNASHASSCEKQASCPTSQGDENLSSDDRRNTSNSLAVKTSVTKPPKTERTRKSLPKKVSRTTRKGRKQAAKKSRFVDADTRLRDEDKVKSKDSSIPASNDEQSNSGCHAASKRQVPSQEKDFLDNLQLKKRQGTDDKEEINKQDTKTSSEKQRLTDDKEGAGAQTQTNHPDRPSKGKRQVPLEKTKTRRERTDSETKPASEKNGDHRIQLFVNSTSMGPICLQMHPSTFITILNGTLQNQPDVESEKQQQDHEPRDGTSHKDYRVEQDANIEIHLMSGLICRAGDEQKSAGRTRKTSRAKKVRRKTRQGRRRATNKSVNPDSCLPNKDKVKSKDSPISSPIDANATEQSKSGCHVVPHDQAPAGQLTDFKEKLKKQQDTNNREEINQDNRMDTLRKQQSPIDEQCCSPWTKDCEVRDVKDKGSQMTSNKGQGKDTHGHQKGNGEMVKDSSESCKEVDTSSHEEEKHGEEQTCHSDRSQIKQQDVVREQIHKQQTPSTSKKQRLDGEDDLEQVDDLRRSETEREQSCLHQRPSGQEAQKQKQANHQNRLSKDLVPSGRTKMRKEREKDRGCTARQPFREDKGERLIQLFVNTLSSGPICLQMLPSTPVLALKEKLQDHLGIEPEKQRLITRQRHELRDGVSLQDQAIEQDANIELRLVQGLMGGADDEQKSAGNPQKGTDKDPRTRKDNERKASDHHVHIPQQNKRKRKHDERSVPTLPDEHLEDLKLTPVRPKTQSAHEAGQHSSEEEMATSTNEPEKEAQRQGQKPERVSKENRSQKNSQARDMVPAAFHPAMQHPSTVCTHNSSGSLLQPAGPIRDVTVDGKCNPTFFAPSTGHTFNYTYTHTHNVTVQAATPGGMINDQPSPQPIQPEECSQSTRSRQDTQPATAAAADDAADLCEEALKKKYATTGSYVQVNPWIDDDTRDIAKIYTNLRLVSDDDDDDGGGGDNNDDERGTGSNDEMGKGVLYEKTFLVENKNGYVINRIIYNGWAGMGKTTLIVKIAFDWAIGACKTTKKYKLVFVLKMSELDEKSDFIDSLFDQLIDENEIDKDHLKTYIFKNAKKVLLLLDGFDELMTTNLESKPFGSILKILNRRIGENFDVVITTRPSHLSTLVSKSLITKPYTHVKVLGFFEKDIEEFVSKFFHKKPKDAQALFKKIQSSNVLLDLSHSPMLLLLICLLWRQDSTLPETLSRLYRNAERYIFKRKGVPQTEISKIVVAIGKVALRGLMSPVQRISFQEKEFEKISLDIALKAGTLTRQRVMKAIDTDNSTVQFIHKTVQEFCAARYLQSLHGTDAGEFKNILDKLNDLSRFRYILRFCCGDSEACTEHVLAMLQNDIVLAKRWYPNTDPISNRGSRISTKTEICSRGTKGLKLALTCYFESQAKTLLSTFVNSVVTDSIDITYFRSDDINNFVWFLKHVADQSKYIQDKPLAKIKKMTFESCTTLKEGCCEDVVNVMATLTSLTVVRMIGCFLTSSSMKVIISQLGKTANHVTELHLSKCHGLTDSVHLWMPLVNKTHLQKLDLDNCWLNNDDVKGIALLLGDMPNLVQLNIQGCPGLNMVVVHGDNTKLHLCRIVLSASELMLILKTMNNIGNSSLLGRVPGGKVMSELCVEGIESLGGMAAIWSSQVKNGLEQLTIHDCSLQTADVEHIAASLEDTSCLRKLDLSGNESLAGSDWSRLQCLKQLKQLTLDRCGLGNNDVKHIAVLVGCIPNLARCRIDNFFCVEIIDRGVRMKLSELPYTGSQVTTVLKAMANRNDLVEVSFTRISDLSGTAAEWSLALRDLKHLEKLCVINCSLIGTDIEHIVASLSDTATLVELDLSGNKSLDDSGVSWSQLKRLKHLEKLELDRCGLCIHDVKLIAASAGCMHNLVQCSIDYSFQMEKLDKGVSMRLSAVPGVTGSDVADILKAMANHNDLVEVSFVSISGLSGTAAEWSLALRDLKHLEKLCVTYCSLIGTDIEHITASLSDTPTLVKLDLSGNKSLGGSGVYWSQLQRLKHLENLTLDRCGLGIHDVKLIAASAGSMQNLVQCRIGDFFQMNKFERGVNMRLSAVPGVTGSDVADMFKAMANHNDLVEVSFVSISGLSGTAAEWSLALRDLKHLEKLCVTYCSLIGTDIEHITASLSDTPTLVKLDLSGNKSLGGSGVYWSQLQRLKHLEKLALYDCGLGIHDVKLIAASAGSMQNLVQCSIGDFFQMNKFERGVNMRLSAVPGVTGSDVADMFKAMANHNDLVEVSFVSISGLSGTAAEWSLALRDLKHLEKLCVTYCSLIGTDIEHITASLSDTPTLVKLDLSGNKSLGGSGVYWSQLQRLKHLENLTLDRCGLGIHDVKLIAASAGSMHNLVQCSIDYSFQMEKLDRGVRIRLSMPPVTGSNVADILKAMANRNDLVEVSFTGISGLRGTAAEWSLALRDLKHLEMFGVTYCSIKGTDIEHIAESLSDTPTLVELDLSGNKSLGDSGAWVHLKSLKLLRKLTLRSCYLTRHDIEHIASLSAVHNLIKLDLSENKTLSGSGAWPYLKSLKLLQKLTLTSCSLTRQDIEDIASLNGVPTLIKLDLSENKTLSGSGAWPYLKSLKLLQKLTLTSCSLTRQDIEDIASLNGVPTLIKLDLSKNETLSGSGAWSYLKYMEDLKTLALTSCRLRNADIEYIAASLNGMTNLIKLDLSGNFLSDPSVKALMLRPNLDIRVDWW